MTGIIINNNEYTVNTGSTKIEYNSMGGGTVAYSMYGDDIPLIVIPETDTLVSITSAMDTTFYLLSNGDLYGCGSNSSNQMGEPTYYEEGEEYIENTYFPTFTKRASNVKAFYNSSDSLVYIDNNNDAYSSINKNAVSSYEHYTKIASNVKKIEGKMYSCICYLDNNNNLYGCGYNSSGQLGQGHKNSIANFIKLAENVKDFEIYSSAVMYLTLSGDLYCAGNNFTTTFAKYMSNIKEFYVGNSFFCVNNNNDLYGRGQNGWGQLGQGNTTTPISSFVKVASNIKMLGIDNTVNSNTTAYIDSNNDLYMCGMGRDGQLGNGVIVDKNTTPIKVASNVKYVVSNINCSFYIDNNNDLYGTGKNPNGQLGLGNTSQVNTFTKLASNVDFCKASLRTLLYKIKDTNKFYLAGINTSGQIGTGSYGGNVTTFFEHTY